MSFLLPHVAVCDASASPAVSAYTSRKSRRGITIEVVEDGPRKSHGDRDLEIRWMMRPLEVRMCIHARGRIKRFRFCIMYALRIKWVEAYVSIRPGWMRIGLLQN